MRHRFRLSRFTLLQDKHLRQNIRDIKGVCDGQSERQAFGIETLRYKKRRLKEECEKHGMQIDPNEMRNKPVTRNTAKIVINACYGRMLLRPKSAKVLYEDMDENFENDTTTLLDHYLSNDIIYKVGMHEIVGRHLRIPVDF